MNREDHEEISNADALLLTLFILFAMAVAGYLDGPLVGGF